MKKIIKSFVVISLVAVLSVFYAQQGMSEELSSDATANQTTGDPDASSLLGDPAAAPFCGPHSTQCPTQPGAGTGSTTGRGQTCVSTTGHAELC